MNVESREYKLLLDHAPFSYPSQSVKAVWSEIEEAMQTLPMVRTKGKFDEQETRRIRFLDTPDHTLRASGLVLRERIGEQRVEYTLKCRTEDRYFAAGTDVSAASGLESEEKFEEDIAPPFRCRFSRSATISLPERDAPRNLRDAAALFPLLGTLRADGLPCRPETTLAAVHNIVVDETVWKGAKIVFDPTDDEKSEKASVVVMLWSRGESGRPAVAELSFRLKDREEAYRRELVEAARAVYMLLQRMDCARLEGTTKTEYVYRDASRD